MKPQKVMLGGKEWTIRMSARKLKSHGYCDPAQKLIVISRGYSPEIQQETFYHEALHALFWMLDEDVVVEAGHELTNAANQLDFD